MGETTGFAGEAPRVGCVSDGELGFWDVQKTWENGGLMVALWDFMGFNGIVLGFYRIYPLAMTNITLENHHL